MTLDDERTLSHLLDALDEAGDGNEVSVQDILDEIGERSIMPVVLAVSVLLVSPLSAVPGVPTLSAIILVTLIAQAVAGRKHLWIPGFLRNRCVRVDRLQAATRWLRRLAGWFDRHSHPRLRVLTRNPLRRLTLILCMCVPVIWPFLELLPMVTSFGAGAVALMSFGLLTRDGLFILGGYATVAGMAFVLTMMVQAAT
ncbi:MAG: exopolysaccharide biosynthesis protein [Tateyamaria sp.]